MVSRLLVIQYLKNKKAAQKTKKAAGSLLFISLFSLLAITGNAQQTENKYTVYGIITDKLSGELLPYANIFDSISKSACITNSYGYYSLTIPGGVTNVKYSYVGYKNLTKEFKLTGDTLINIELLPYSPATKRSNNYRFAENQVFHSQISIQKFQFKKLKNCQCYWVKLIY